MKGQLIIAFATSAPTKTGRFLPGMMWYLDGRYSKIFQLSNHKFETLAHGLEYTIDSETGYTEIWTRPRSLIWSIWNIPETKTYYKNQRPWMNLVSDRIYEKCAAQNTDIHGITKGTDQYKVWLEMTRSIQKKLGKG